MKELGLQDHQWIEVIPIGLARMGKTQEIIRECQEKEAFREDLKEKDHIPEDLQEKAAIKEARLGIMDIHAALLEILEDQEDFQDPLEKDRILDLNQNRLEKGQEWKYQRNTFQGKDLFSHRKNSKHTNQSLKNLKEK